MSEWRTGPILGRGSSATVSLATSSPTGELIAVKSAELSKSYLQHEQSIHSSLNCPQIISYLGFEITSLHYNLFIEYAPGGSLSDHCGSLSDAAIRSLTHDILSGLAYLHSRSIVHCDIKPQNILIGSDGGAKIADFGCARRMSCPKDVTSNKVRGTPMFMAPEVARGEEQGTAADVWALGCTVVSMATGGPPWPESDSITTLHRVAFSSEVPEIPSWMSEEGKDFLRKCLVSDLNERWTVDRLLKNPFVCLGLFKSRGNSSWSSPTRILDLRIWETETEEEEQTVSSNDRSRLKIRELEGSCHGGPNWTWDGSWTIVRINGEEGHTTSTANDEVTITVAALENGGTSQQSVLNSGNLFFDGVLECSKGNELQQISYFKRYSTRCIIKEFCYRDVVFGLLLFNI